MKNFNDNIGNRTRDLPTCSAVPEPTALPGAPVKFYSEYFYEDLSDKIQIWLKSGKVYGHFT